jgi:hypothetical protein
LTVFVPTAADFRTRPQGREGNRDPKESPFKGVVNTAPGKRGDAPGGNKGENRRPKAAFPEKCKSVAFFERSIYDVKSDVKGALHRIPRDGTELRP